jgi:glycosyltransferase involved in cell wall biosynthesis
MRGTPADSTRPTLLVFADDWGRHPSSCQHLVRKLLPEHEVWWVNTIGTRAPTLNLATAARGWEKLRLCFGRNSAMAEQPAQLHVLNPWMWPWFRTSHCRRWNRKLLQYQLAPVVASMTRPVTAITTLPIVADLVGTLKVDRWIYYCVDDFGQWPGLDHEPLRLLERQLVSQVDEIIVVSETLQKRIEALGRRSTLLTHGVELEHWSSEARRSSKLSAKIPATLEQPWIVFWGVVDRRLNVDFLAQLTHDLQQGTVLLVGPENDPDPALNKLPRLVRTGPLSYDLLPQLAAEAAVLVMPYADLPVTRAMQPLKLKEYLATGKPIVVSELPACQPWADCLDVTRTPADFSAAVRRRIREGLTATQRAARARLSQETWDAKAAQFKSRLAGAAECHDESAAYCWTANAQL